MDIVSRESQVSGLGASDVDLKEGERENQDGEKDLDSILKSLDEISVHQHLDAIEVCLGWERNNRYSLYNVKGDQVLYAYEVAQCYTRQCYGSLREFSLVMTDNDDNRLLRVHRPLRCSSRCFYACCSLQEMTITSKSSKMEEKVWKVFERWSCCIPQYRIEDDHGNVQFEIEGTSCHCRCCCSVLFKVNAVGGEQCATVKKRWGGCKEFIGACNDYSISYFHGVSSSDKSAILGASFLLDFNYFQRHGKCF